MSRPAPRDPTLTPWLAAGLRPARVGVYRRAGPAGPFACWDGRRWHEDAPSADAAAARRAPSQRQAAPWRGLAAPAATPCSTCGGTTVIDHGLAAAAEADRIDECPDC